MQQDKILEIKTKILNRKNVDTRDLNPMITESWIRCRDMNLTAQTTILPHTILKHNFIDTIPQKNIQLSKEIKAMPILQSMLEPIGAALFYLDANLCAYNKIGNATLLDELKQKNIRNSTSFQEKHIGTTAVCCAEKTRKLFWCVGHENYRAALTDYACCALVTDPTTNLHNPYSMYSNIDTNIVIFIHTKNLNPMTKSIIESIANMHSLISRVTQPHEPYILYELWKNTDKSAVLTINPAGIIIHCNESFCDIFQVSPANLIGHHYDSKLPQLRTTIQQVLKGAKIKEMIMNLRIGQITKEYIIDSAPVYDEQKNLVGIYMTVRYSNEQKKSVHRLTHFKARFRFEDIVGNSPKMRVAKMIAEKASNNTSTVLITGESGSGKELFAQAIHNASNRAHHPFIAINCAAIPHELIGSELFGHVEGAFTGAKRGGSIGKFEQANNGTIFLDEISEMPLDMQAVLLRVLEERIIVRLGDNLERHINVRVVVASNRNLLQYVKEGKFRADLYYRLNVLQVDIPPLRERMDDLPLLVKSLLQQISKASEITAKNISEQAMQRLYEYSWPGNVRELRNIIERCLVLETGTEISPETIQIALPESRPDNITCSAPTLPENNASFKENQAAQVKKLMQIYNGNVSRVAREMGISRGKVTRIVEKINNWN